MSHPVPDPTSAGAEPGSRTSSPLPLAVLIGLAAAFALAGYEFVRSPTNTIYKAVFGKESLAMGMAFIPLAVALVVYVYARLLSRFGARATLMITTLGSAGLIAGLQLLHDQGFAAAAAALYLFRSAYVVLLIEQYWSFINSTLSGADARKLNGPICGIASIGSVLAGVAGSQLTGPLGTTGMVYFAAAATLPAAFFSDWAYRRFGEPTDRPPPATRATDHLALKLFTKDRLLLLLLGIVIVTQVVAALLSLSFQGELQDAIPDPDTQTAWSFSYYAWINGIAAVLQFFVAPLVMHRVPPGPLHLAIPFAHVIALGAYLNAPGLMTAAVAHAAFKCVDYSVFRAAKEILYIPMPFDARYRAKEVIDVFGYRFSKGLTSGAVAILGRVGFVMTEVTHGVAALAATVIWLGLAVLMKKRTHTAVAAD